MEFVTFDIAKKLKEKGFMKECLCHYIGEDLVYNVESPIANNQLWFSHNKFDNMWHRDNVDAPTISQVLKWLRMEKKIYVYPHYLPNNNVWMCFIYNVAKQRMHTVIKYNDYEEAALAGIEYVLDNLI